MKIASFLAVALGMAFLLSIGLASAHAQSPKALLLFGGEDHKTFLGCLNCVSTAPTSICNEYGEFGSKYQVDSIWNEYGTFGSKYQVYSPWNQYSTDAPVIVDQDGNSYGYFSANQYRADRTHIGWLTKILDFQVDQDDLDKTRDALCAE